MGEVGGREEGVSVGLLTGSEEGGGEVLYHSVALYISNVEPASHNIGRSCRGFKGWVQRIRFLLFSFVIIR